jgi:hypothetical protein
LRATRARQIESDKKSSPIPFTEKSSLTPNFAAQFPRLRARLDTAVADYAAAPDNSFEFGLQAILDGIEAQLITRRMPAG